MSSYPAPVPLSEQVTQARLERTRRMIRAAASGVAVRVLIITAELLGFVFLNSSVLLLDALHSLTDVAASLLVILGIKLADRPPDRTHPFGHGRYEPLAGLQLALLITLVGGGLMVQQLFAFSAAEDKTPINRFTWLIPFVAVLLLELSYQVIMRTAKRENSAALAADAVHYRTDSFSSMIAVVTLGIAAWLPQWSVTIDHLGAIVLAGAMILMGLWAAKVNANQLLDRIPEESFFERVKATAHKVEGVLGVEKTRIQLAGPDAHVDIDIEVEPTMAVKDAHQISQLVRAAIQEDWPAVRDVVVHVEPYYEGDH